jgi:thiol:disulfide interchange protein DsbC
LSFALRPVSRSWLLLGACAVVAGGWALLAGATAVDPAIAAVSAHMAGSKPEEFRATPVAGIFEYRHGADIIYVTQDGRYAFTGDMFSMGDRVNLTEARRKELRLKLLADVPESSMVIFAAQQPKYTITVFTDIDCGFCRKLHSQIAEYNRLGITVRYLAFPRDGPGTESWAKAQQVWCAPDRKDALTRAKLGETLHVARCDDPVAREYSLGRAMGINGTPGILTSSGDMLPGYMPPDELVSELKGSG